ncbi:MAG TPA: glutathionylspermidine synthase family protein [Roseimicrobium sp.]|nr:glutathionylspermidine synthase family protein [Roseimicrobium sp.]
MRPAISILAPPPRVASPAGWSPLTVGKELPDDVFSWIRRQMTLVHCKWDPQVEDVPTLARFPLLIHPETWADLRQRAEALSAETIAMERALIRRPELHPRLGLPRPLTRLFRTEARETPAATRSMRFDFHFTSTGWRISEVNSDVPGGFSEASSLSRLFAENATGTCVAGDPAEAWADAMVHHANVATGPVALLSAPGFMEDQQVVSYLAERLRNRGIECHLIQPCHLRWRDGAAFLKTTWSTAGVSAIVRFFQAEWLGRLGHRAEWQPLFVNGTTPVANPGIALLSESKRLPLVWDDLGLDLPAWRAHLPATRNARDAPWRHDESWLIKTAYCNTGDSVAYLGRLTPRQWSRTSLLVRLRPGNWIAQERFETLPIATPRGPMYPSLGVFTIDGNACGIYGRLSATPVIDYAATDVAVLIDNADTEVDQ